MSNKSTLSITTSTASLNKSASALGKSVSYIQPDPKFWTKTSWIQLGYGIWVNLTVIGFGLAFGFTAVALPQLNDVNSKIKITLKDEAYIASALTLSFPIGCILCGILMDRRGRKIALVLCEIPIAAGWFYIGLAATANDIVVGRIITGVGLGMAMVAPRAYINEITLPNMRGVLGALPNMFTAIGLTIQAGLGLFLNWYFLCYISGAYTIILLILNIYLPESPYYTMLHANAADAGVVLKKFRSKKFNMEGELSELAEFKEINDIRRLTSSGTAKAVFRPSSCKPFGIILFYIILMQVVGVNVVIMWSVEMLELSNSSIDPYLGNIYMSLTRIFVGLLTSWLLFKVPRRAMALTSAIGLGIAAISLGVFMHAHKKASPYPQIFFIAYITFATLGYYTLPFLMMFELLPLQVRGIMSGILLSTFSLIMFGANRVYPILLNSIGLANTVILYGSLSLFGAAVLYLILPETKDLTLQEIEEYFNSRRPTLVSQRRVMSMQILSKPGLPAQTDENLKHRKPRSTRRPKTIELQSKLKKVNNKEKDNKSTEDENDDKEQSVNFKESKEDKKDDNDTKDKKQGIIFKDV